MIAFRKYRESDWEQVCSVVRKTYRRFNAKEGSRLAVQKYLDNCNPNKRSAEDIKNTFRKTYIFYVAVDNGKIIGIIRGTSRRLVNFFVLGQYHNKSIGKKLYSLFERDCKKENVKVITVRASIYAIPIYEKLGYKKTTGIRSFKGLNIQPMRKIL